MKDFYNSSENHIGISSTKFYQATPEFTGNWYSSLRGIGLQDKVLCTNKPHLKTVRVEGVFSVFQKLFFVSISHPAKHSKSKKVKQSSSYCKLVYMPSQREWHSEEKQIPRK